MSAPSASNWCLSTNSLHVSSSKSAAKGGSRNTISNGSLPDCVQVLERILLENLGAPGLEQLDILLELLALSAGILRRKRRSPRLSTAPPDPAPLFRHTDPGSGHPECRGASQLKTSREFAPRSDAGPSTSAISKRRLRQFPATIRSRPAWDLFALFSFGHRSPRSSVKES